MLHIRPTLLSWPRTRRVGRIMSRADTTPSTLGTPFLMENTLLCENWAGVTFQLFSWRRMTSASSDLFLWPLLNPSNPRINRHIVLKNIKSTPRYTEIALDEIKLLQHLITLSTPLKCHVWVWHVCTECWWRHPIWVNLLSVWQINGADQEKGMTPEFWVCWGQG